MNVALYARVSSERQDIDLSISAQLKALREYAASNSHLVTKEYIDEAESGRSIDRPGFKQMIVAARQKNPGPQNTGPTYILIEAKNAKPLQVRFFDEMPDVEITLTPARPAKGK